MQLSKIPIILAMSFFSSFAFAHGEETRVDIELESSAKISASATLVSFQLVDTKENKLINPDNLNISHEKKLHFIAYDPSLKEFQHVHPEFDGKVWNINLNFSVNGNYFIWAQGELAIDAVEFNALTRIEVTGGQPAWPAPILGDVRSGSLTGSVAQISGQVLHAGKMAMLTLRITKEDGSPAEITPYLGAFAHVIATSMDGDSLIHIHPMNGSLPNEGMVHATFPEAGDYRVWVQFIDSGILKTVPLSVTVTN